MTFADLLLHLVDFSDPNFEEKRLQTESVLRDIGALDIPKIMIYNKIDKLSEGAEGLNSDSEGFYVSALSKVGLKELRGDLHLRAQMFSQNHG